MKNWLTCFLFFSSLLSVSAQTTFTENKGQWEDQIRFQSNIKLGKLFITNNGMAFHLANQEQLHQQMHPELNDEAALNAPVDYHAYCINLINCNPKASFQSSKALPTYEITI